MFSILNFRQPQIEQKTTNRKNNFYEIKARWENY